MTLHAACYCSLGARSCCKQNRTVHSSYFRRSFWAGRCICFPDVVQNFVLWSAFSVSCCGFNAHSSAASWCGFAEAVCVCVCACIEFSSFSRNTCRNCRGFPPVRPVPDHGMQSWDPMCKLRHMACWTSAWCIEKLTHSTCPVAILTRE